MKKILKNTSLKSEQDLKTPKNDQDVLEELGFTAKVLRHVLFASAVSLASISVFTAIFYFAAHGSFNHIYLGYIPLKATERQKQIEQKIDAAAKKYQVTMQYPDGSKKSYPLSSVGITVDSAASARESKQLINASVPERLRWWKPIYLQLEVRVDRPKLKNFINTEATKITLAPKDAALAKDSGAVVLTPDQPGKGSRIDHAYGAIFNAVSTLQTSPLVFKPAVLQPTITAAELKPSQDKVNELLSQKIAFNVAGHEVVASKNDIAGWIELSPVNKEKTVDVNVDSGKILQYINKISKPYVQPPRSRLITNTENGQVVLDAGASGIDVLEKDKTAVEVAKKLRESKGVKTDLTIKYAASQTVEVQPYDKWLVADTTTKRMYAYEGTNLVKTFLVSAGAPATPTVKGKFAIYAKHKSQTMTGANADGSRYTQPDVPYVNYFYKDYAVHGNYWRPSSYFGNINSSHGCLGVTTSDGAWIYDWAPIGTPVIVHS